MPQQVVQLPAGAQLITSDPPQPDPRALALQGAVAYGATQNPDNYAKRLQIQRQTGIGPLVSEGNEESIRQIAAARALDPHTFTATNPRTAQWAANPDNAAVSGVPEIQRLGGIEQNANAMRSAPPQPAPAPPSLMDEFWSALKDAVSHPLESLVGADTPAMAAQKQAMVQQFEEAAKKENAPLAQSIVAGAKLDEKAETTPLIRAYGAGGTAFGKPISATPQFQSVLSPTSQNVLSRGLTGTMKAIEGLSTPHNLGLMATIPLAPEDAAPVISGVFGAQMTEGAASGGYNAIHSQLTGDTGGAAENAVMALVNAEFARRSALHAMGVVKIPGVPEAGDGAASPQHPSVASSPYLSNLSQAVEAAASSALRERAPDKFYEANQTNFDGDPSLRIPVDKFDEYFKGQAMDPRTVANGLGSSNYVEAAMSGGDVEVPPAGFLSKLDPAHQRALLTDIVDPSTGLTARQDQEGRAELEQWVTSGAAAKLVSDFAAADAETAASPEHAAVKEDLRGRYEAAGEAPEVAEALATKDANVYSNLARGANLKPSEVLAMYNPKVTVGDAPAANVPADVLAASKVTLFQSQIPSWFKNMPVPAEGEEHPALAQLRERAAASGVPLNEAQESAAREAIDAAARGDDAVWSAAQEKYQELRDEDPRTAELRAAQEVYSKLQEQVTDDPTPENLAALSEAGKAVRAEQEKLAANAPRRAADQPRGWYRKLKSGTLEFGRTPGADLSTDLHEWGHGYLDMMHDLAQREGSSQQLKDDYQTALDFIGAKAGEPRTREQNEKWAKATERYLHEGKAPSPSLRDIFQRFAIWMDSVYKSLSAHGVELSDEIRGVFDRLYAAEEGVNRAEAEAGPQLFKTPEEAGFTQQQLDEYAAQNEMSVDRAKAEILGRLNEAALRDRTEAWREEKRNVRQAMTDAVDAQPAQRAIRSLQKGEMEDGTPLTLNKQALVDQFGEERVKALQKVHKGIYRLEGGTDAETAAELHGFGSGEEMMRTLEATPRRNAAIEAATREYMTAKHGDIRYDGTLDDQARVALENDEKANLLHRQLVDAKRKLAEMQGTQAALRAIDVAPIAKYRELAEQATLRKSAADLQPTRKLDAMGKYSREAKAAAIKGDAEAYAEALHKELLNHYLFREEQKAKRFVEGAVKQYANVFKSDSSIGKTRNIDLVNAARSILSGVGIGRIGQREVDLSPAVAYLADIQKYNPELYNEMAPLVDNAINGSKGNYRNMSVDAFRQLKTTVDALWLKSRTDMQVEIDGQMVYRDNVLHDLNTRLDEIGPRKSQPGVTHAVTTADRAQRGMDNMVAARRRVESWADAKDGASGPGYFTKYIVRPVLNAATEYRLAKEEPMMRLRDIVAGIEPKRGMILAPELGYTFGKGNSGIGIYELLGAIMHTGNESNMRKLLLGRKWGAIGEMGELDTLRWDSFMGRMHREGVVTKDHWDAIQKVWDLNAELKPKAQETFRRLFGYNFKEIEQKPVETPFGSYRGGYVPAKTDPFMVRDAQRNAKMEDLESDFRNAMPSTGHGFTNARIEDYTKPLSMDLRVIMTHIDDTLRFAYMQPAIKDVLSLVRDHGFADNLTAQDPATVEEMLLPWLNRSARQMLEEKSAEPWLDQTAKYVHGGVTAATMFGNIANVAIHVTNFASTALKVEPGHMFRSLFRYVGSPLDTTRNIVENSDFMKTRLDLQTKRMQTSINNMLEGKGAIGNAQSWFQDHAYFLQHAIWNVNDIVAWDGAYNQAMEQIGKDMSPEDANREAVQRADAVVRLTQGSENPEDVSLMQVGTPLHKLMTQFTGWINSQANLHVTEAVKAGRDLEGAERVQRFAYMALSFIALHAGANALVGGVRGSYKSDEPLAPQLLSWFFGSAAKGAMSEFVPYGNLAISAADKRIGAPAISVLGSSTFGVAHAAKDAWSDDKEVTSKDVHDVLTLMTLATKLPFAAAGRPLGYMMDVHRGKVQPTSGADAARGVLTGTASDDSLVH